MVDAAIVMVENVHKHIEAFEGGAGRSPTASERWRIVSDASLDSWPRVLARVDEILRG